MIWACSSGTGLWRLVNKKQTLNDQRLDKQLLMNFSGRVSVREKIARQVILFT